MSLRGLGKRETGSVAGSAPVRLFAEAGGSSPHRKAIQFANCDAGRTVFLRFGKAGDSAPTLSSTNFDFAVPPRATLTLEASAALDLWALNDSGGATTSAYAAVEVLG
jgi:hypothetical protein